MVLSPSPPYHQEQWDPFPACSQISRDSVHQPMAGSAAACRVGPQRMQSHPHLLQEHIHFPCFSHHLKPNPQEC